MKNNKYKAIALDLDGTLTDSNKRLPEENKEAVWKAIDAGCIVILVSGRAIFGISKLAGELELDRRGGYVVAYNGGNIIDWKTGEMLYERMLPAECIHDICEQASANGVVALTYTPDGIVAENDTDEYIMKEAKCNGSPIRKVDNLEAFVDYPVSKFLVVGVHEKLRPVQEALLGKHGDVIDAFFSEEYFLEIVPKGVKKSAALESLLLKLKIDRSELIAFGDGMNDIPMLEYAGFSVVMQNAYPGVKKYADYITLSNDECGVAHAIEKFVL